MSVTTFTTVNGMILSQAKDGVVSHFVPDPLGSVVMVRDTSGNTVYEAEYDPYGNVQSETGTNPSPLGYVGTLGYIKDSATSLYVRARYLLNNLGRWLTKDPLWPSEPGYVYVGSEPTVMADPSGLLVVKIDPACDKPPYKGHGIAFKVRQLCNNLDSRPSCGCECSDWKNTYDCLKEKCNSTIVVKCLNKAQCDSICKNGGDSRMTCACAFVPSGTVYLCAGSVGGNCGCLQNTILHEMVHGCGHRDESVPNCVAAKCTAGLPECGNAGGWVFR